jgi:hypothetical protein
MEIEFDRGSHSLIVKTRDEISFDSYKKMAEAVASSPLFRPGVSVIYDLREAQLGTTTNDDVHAIVRYANAMATQRGSGWRVAIVVSSMVGFGMGRMLEGIMGASPIKTLVTKDLEAAKKWARESEQVVSGID